MNDWRALVLVLAVVPLALGGCDSVSTLLGGKSSPDEFTVYSRAPLSIPPEYKLRPPSPGAARPQAINPRDKAEDVMLASHGVSPKKAGKLLGQKNGPESTGQKALVHLAGGDHLDPDIRAIVNREAVVPIEASKTLADKIIFWRNPRKRVSIVDPAKENKRIRQQLAKGLPVTGKGVPVINRDLDRNFIDKLLFD